MVFHFGRSVRVSVRSFFLKKYKVENKNPIAAVGKIGNTTNWRYKGKYYTAEIPPFDWDWYYSASGDAMRGQAERQKGVFELAYRYYKSIVEDIGITYDKPAAFKFVKGLRAGFVESGGYWVFPPLPAVDFITGLDFGRYFLATVLHYKTDEQMGKYIFTGGSLVKQDFDNYEVTASLYDMPSAFYDAALNVWHISEVREASHTVRTGKIIKNQDFELVFDYTIESGRVGLVVVSVVHYKSGRSISKFTAGRVAIVFGGLCDLSAGDLIGANDFILGFEQVKNG